MNIIVSKDIVKLNENHSENHYGEYNVNECVFEFDEYFDSVPIKKAIFTSQSNNKSFEIDIINNKCTVPHEVLTKVYDTVILGVYGYDVNEETLLVRYSPEPTTFVVHEGSYREGAEQPEIITPTQYDMYSKALQEGLAEVDKRLDDVEKQGDYASEQGDYAKEQGDYAKSEGDNAKSVAEETEKKAQEGAFDGKSLEFVWEGTKLGVRLEGQEEYHFVDLQGKQGEIGATGEPFKIKKTYASVSEMNADFRNMEFGDYVMIASSVEVEDNAKLYTRGESAWIFISDFSGAMGIRGETGLTPNIQIGEVKTLEAGSQAKVTRSGSNEEPVLNFEIPKGDKGDNYVLTEEDKVEIGKKVNTEYEERIEQNEKYISELEATIDILTNTDKAKGELVHITDALPLATFENKIDGNVKQETTKGQQLFDYKDTISVSDGVTTDEDGWITMTYDNTNGTATKYFNYWTRNLKLKENTKYNILCEIKNVSGTGSVFVVSISDDTPIQFTESQRIYLNNLTNNSIVKLIGTTKENLENIASALRTYGQFNAGQSGSITFRLSVLEDTTVTPETFVYEKYTGGQASPNPSYPQEVEVLEGYNLFNPNITNFNNKNVSSFEKKGIENGSVGGDAYKLYSTNTRAVAYINLSKIDTYTISSKYMIVQLCEVDENGTITKILPPYTFTNTKNTICVVFKKDNSNTAFTDSEYDDLKNSIQLVEGTTPKPYLPYGCVGYKIVGKNRLNMSLTQERFEAKLNKIENEKIYLNVTGQSPSLLIKQYIPKGKYKVKKSEAIKGSVVFKSSTDETIGDIGGLVDGEKVIEFSKDINSIVIYLNANYYDTSKEHILDFNSLVMVNETDSTDYEPYKEQIVPLDLKGNFVGAINDDIKDYLVTDKKKYWLVKNIGKVVLDGSEEWYVASSVVSDTTRFYTDFNIYNSRNEQDTNVYTISDKLIGLSWAEIYSNNTTTKNAIGNYNNLNNNAGRIVIRIENTYASTVEEFKQWLSENNVEVYYALAEPEIIELGELPEPIKTFEGVNNIQLLANLDTEIEVTYALDVKKYFENKLASIQEQIL